MAGSGVERSTEEFMEEAVRAVRELDWVRNRETRPPMAVMALAVPGATLRPSLPIPYPRWGVRPEEQSMRLNSWIDPFREIPATPVHEITAATTLTTVRGSMPRESAKELETLTEAGEEEIQRRDAVWRWNRHHGGGHWAVSYTTAITRENS
jgi:hypothetical protein